MTRSPIPISATSRRASSATNIAMFVLAAFSVLNIYRFGSIMLSYSMVLGLLLFMLAFFNKMNKSPYPKSYIIMWFYWAFQLILIGGGSVWQDFIPGGMQFFLFSLCMAGFILYFDLSTLHKYIKIIWLIASVLFLVQFAAFHTTGTRISFFLPLGNSLIYEGYTYIEMIQAQMSTYGSDRFSSIFAEPSYLAQFALVFLCFEFFCDENKSKLYTTLIVYTGIVLLLLQSGVGLLGTAFLVLVKLIYLLTVQRKMKYYFMLAILVPIVIFIIRWYLGSEIGQYVVDRTEQLSFDDTSATNSGFVRLYYGYYEFGTLDTFNQLFGVSRSEAGAMREYGGFYNGIAFILCQNGLIGALLMLLFIILNCIKKNIFTIAISLLFIFVSAMESTYLAPLMMMTFVIVCAMPKQSS